MTPKITLFEANQRLLDKHGTSIEMFNYISISEYADFRCVNGHEWRTKAGEILGNRERGCPKCYHIEVGKRCRIDEKEVINRIFLTHGDKITLLFYAGDAAVGKSRFRCNVCGNIWETNAKGIYRGNGCWECGVISRGIKHRGSNSNLWKGGVTKLRPFIKGNLDNWKKDSMLSCEYKCALTNSKDFEIHHLYPLNNIIQDSLLELGLGEFEFIDEYSEEELRPIIDKIIEIHYRYPLGICLRKDIHILFHKLYGRNKCTPEDFYEFAERIKNGEIQI